MGKIEGQMGKSKEEGGGEGRGNGGIITGGSIAKKKSKKNKTSKKAKGKTFQVLSLATARVRHAVRDAAHVQHHCACGGVN